MADATLHYELDDHGLVTITLQQRKLLGAKSAPVADWAKFVPKGAGALAHVMATAEDGGESSDGTPLVEVGEDHLRLHPDFVAALDSDTASALQLPPPTSLAIDLRSEGLINEPSFRINARWVRPGGSPVRARVIGAFVTQDGQDRRIPEPLHSLWRACSKLASPMPEPERMTALAELKALIPDDAGQGVHANGYLHDLRIHYASGFSLKLGRGGPFDFDPVLFSRRAVAESQEGAALDEEADSVLPPSAQLAFAGDRFRASEKARAAYVLRDGAYVYIDPALRPALEIVRNLQDAPEGRRREFLSNPRRVIREALSDSAAEAVDELFVETEQFSRRVAGVDVWRTPVLPWLKQQPNTWLPEAFGVRVGDDYVVVPPDKVEPLIDAITAAINTGQPTAIVEGLQVPATPQALEALEALKPFAVESHPEKQGLEEAAPPFEQLPPRLFLVVSENFEEVVYAPFQRQALRDHPPIEVPPSVVTDLKPHQREGFHWLAQCLMSGRPGVLLADDMGLGKTLQALAFLAWIQAEMRAGRRPRRPLLIIAPTGLLANWREEIEKHLDANGLGELVLAFGSSLRLLRDEDALSARDIEIGRAALRSEAWRSAGVVLTTYETMRDFHFSFARTRFGAIVFDEIQKLKNPTSQVTRAAKTLNADFTVGMTGTPVENRLQDLWSIMDVLSPGLLGSSRDFDRAYPTTEPAALGCLRSLLTERQNGEPAHMLRRLKSDHLPGLPQKTVRAERLPMPPRQASAYIAVLRRAVASREADPGPGAMLQTLHALRGVSLHPVDPTDAPTDLDAYAKDSARLKWAVEVLEQVRARNEKALVFLESLAMQERLAALIQQRFGLLHAPHRIHGGVPGSKRQEFVRAFQRTPGVFDVMILSPKAGGVGLTLTAANHVIHLSRWWNPAVEDQSTDRVYRIGQNKEVFVYLPLAEHPDPTIGPMSFDIRLHELIERKRSLSQHMLAPPEGDSRDVADLFDAVSGNPGPLEPPSIKGSIDTAPPSAEVSEASAPPPTPASADLVRSLQMRRWRLAPGQPRPLDEILAPLANQKIVQVRIFDPYAIADERGRRAQAAFIAELLKRVDKLDSLVIEYAVRDNSYDDERRQRMDMNRRLLAVTEPKPLRIVLKARLGRRDGGTDFHDRTTFIDCALPGGGIATHELAVGRGLLGLMNRDFECTATYAPPGAA